METELDPLVAAYIQEERLSGRAPGTTALLRAANIDIDPRNKSEQFEWAWRRRAGLAPAITIWAEGILPVDAERWISVERIDTDHRRSGQPWHASEVPRAQRRSSILREAFQEQLPLLAFLQINRYSNSQLVFEDKTSEVAVRVRDRTSWYVAAIQEDNLAVLVRGREPWTPIQEQIAAAEALWRADPRRDGDATGLRGAFDPLTAPIIFVNIGWMRRYQGPAEDDQIMADNFGYFAVEGNPPTAAHEQWNFAPTDGMVYGYVPRSTPINISRLGASGEAQSAEGVLVVFMSRDPAEDLLKVVGWYRDATVYRKESFTHQRGDLSVSTSITARAAEATVLPVADRRIVIPTAQREAGGVGQSPIWYGTDHSAKVRDVRDLVAQYELQGATRAPAVGHPGRAPRQPDLETRLKVEKAAMDMAMAYFDSAKDVSKDAKGWDIEALDSHGTIYVEVKGLSGNVVSVELTPNEYDKMGKHRERYVLFVVTGALTMARRSRSFRFVTSADAWLSAEGERLVITQVIAARASVI